MNAAGLERMDLSRHDNKFPTLAETAVEPRLLAPYAKTFEFDGDFIDERHRQLASRLLENGLIDYGIEGWLLPADAQKIYEMAYFTTGDILELGTYKGLSSAIMASACRAAQREAAIISVDLNAELQTQAKENLLGRPGSEQVQLHTAEGALSVRHQAAHNKSYGFAFIDHSHHYDYVFEVCRVLHRVVTLNGFALFHDFNDPRNTYSQALDYGVSQGAMDGLDQRLWELRGIFGCTALFRRFGAW